MDYIQNKIEEYMANNNSDPIDHLIVEMGSVAFIHRLFQTDLGWHSPSSAVYTVPAGKKLIIVRTLPGNALQRDTGWRLARLQNISTGQTVVGPTQFQYPGWVDGDMDSSSGSLFPEVPAGETVELQLFNSGDPSAGRRIGAVVIGKIVNA